MTNMAKSIVMLSTDINLLADDFSNMVTQLKEQVKNAILDGVIENTFEAADAFMRERAAEIGLYPTKTLP